MPKTRELTSQVRIIENRRDWFGEEDYERQAVFFMLASRYGVNKLSLFCGRNSALFSTPALRKTVDALVWLWREHRAAVCEMQDIDSALELIDTKFFTQIRDANEREEARHTLRELTESAMNDLHLYQDVEQADIMLEMLKLAFRHEQFSQLQTALDDADNTCDTPQQYCEAAEKALSRLNVNPMLEVKYSVAFEDDEYLERAFTQAKKPIIKLPGKWGPLAKALERQLVPTGFISFMGPEKRGKSWMLQELAIQSVRSGNETLFIQCGDMSIEEVKLRIATRLAGRSSEEEYCGEILYPVLDCRRNQQNECNRSKRCCGCGLQVEKKERKNGRVRKEQKSEKQNELTPQDLLNINPDYTPCSECSRSGDRAWIPAYWWEKRNPVEPLNLASAKKSFEKMSNKCGGGGLYILEWPSDTLTMAELSMTLDHFQTMRSVFPKVIVLDYMDLMASEKQNSKDYRHFQNELWKSMRGLAQKEEMLIITATQANIGAQDADYIDMVHISEDKRKSAHVTAMWGLNQTKREKEHGIMRLNQIVARSGRFDTRQQFTVLQCLEIGNPILAGYVSSHFGDSL